MNSKQTVQFTTGCHREGFRAVFSDHLAQHEVYFRLKFNLCPHISVIPCKILEQLMLYDAPDTLLRVQVTTVSRHEEYMEAFIVLSDAVSMMHRMIVNY